MPFDQIVVDMVERQRSRFQQGLAEEDVAAHVGSCLELQYAADPFGEGAGAVAFIVGYSKYVYAGAADGEPVICYGLLTDEGMEYALANGLQITTISDDDPRMRSQP